jgi:hypothetical protein
MDAAVLAIWRDAALILLAAQAMVLALLPAIAFYWGLRGIRRLQQWIRPVLFQTRLYVWRAQHEAQRGMDAVATPFVWVQSAAEGLQQALHMLGWR